MHRPVPFAPLVLALALGPGCTTSVEQVPARVDQAQPARAERSAAWTVRTDGEPRGSVVLFRELDGPERTLHVVRNEYGQDMGYVDALGRCWRRRVHSEESELLGTGPLLTGVLRILGREDDPDPELVLASLTPAGAKAAD